MRRSRIVSCVIALGAVAGCGSDESEVVEYGMEAEFGSTVAGSTPVRDELRERLAQGGSSIMVDGKHLDAGYFATECRQGADSVTLDIVDNGLPIATMHAAAGGILELASVMYAGGDTLAYVKDVTPYSVTMQRSGDTFTVAGRFVSSGGPREATIVFVCSEILPG